MKMNRRWVIFVMLVICCSTLSSVLTWQVSKGLRTEPASEPEPEPDREPALKPESESAHMYYDPYSHIHDGWLWDYDVQYDIYKTHSHRSKNGEETLTHSHLPLHSIRDDKDMKHSHLYMRLPEKGSGRAYNWRRNINDEWVHRHDFAVDIEGHLLFIDHTHPNSSDQHTPSHDPTKRRGK